MGITVGELNTLSDGKGITGIRFFNEMENTNESTNVRKLTDVRMSKNHCCQENHHRSAVSVTRITVLTSDIPINFKSTSFPEPKAAAKISVFTKLHGQKPLKSSSESESGVHCCHAAVKKCQNLKKMEQQTRRKRNNSIGNPEAKPTDMRRNQLRTS